MALALVACQEHQSVDPTDLEIVLENSTQFRQAEIEALAGSTESTDDIIQFYSRCYKRPGFTAKRERECIDRFEYWIKVGLENGSPVAAQRQTVSILQTNSCYEVYRAEHLYGKFKQYFQSSPDFLKSVAAEISEKKKACVWQYPEKQENPTAPR